MAEYDINAVTEKVNVKASSALPRRSFVSERDTAARLTSQVTYHEKNQGVIRSSAPKDARATSTIVRVVGTRHM